MVTSSDAARTNVCNHTPSAKNVKYENSPSNRASRKSDVYGFGEMMLRREALDTQLVLLLFDTYNVQGDGNCVFRAASYSAYGTKDNHDDLTAKTASCILQHSDAVRNKFGLNELRLQQIVADVSTLKVAAEL